MKKLKPVIAALLLPAFLATPFAAVAAEKEKDKIPKNLTRSKPALFPVKNSVKWASPLFTSTKAGKSNFVAKIA